MEIFKVPVTFEAYGTVDIEAKDMAELMQKLNDPDFVGEMDIPDGWDYVDASYKVEFDTLKAINSGN